MKKTILAIGILILFIITVFIPMSIGYNIKISIKSKDGNILYVGGSGPGNYSKIQDAIDNASEGDTVFVYNGMYEEHLDIDESIKLIGENKFSTIINNSNIDFNQPNIYFSGFTVQDGYGISISNISIFPSYNNTIKGNVFKSNYPWKGDIYIYNSSNNIISNNSFFNTGLYFSNVNHLHNILYNNTVNNKPLVYFEDTSDKIIGNAGQAILVRCNNITIESQEIYNTSCAIQLFNTNNSYFINNIISNNAYGVILDSSNNNRILKNKFNSNYLDIGFLKESYNITIVDNSFLTSGIYINNFNLKGWNTHTIINNTINEGKIYYYKNDHVGTQIPSDASQIILANCSNCIIKNLNLSNVICSIQLGFSSYNTIIQNNFNNLSDAIQLICSSNNNISYNILNDNFRGFDLYNSKENYINKNSFKNNSIAIGSSFYDSNGETFFSLPDKNIFRMKLFKRDIYKRKSTVESSKNIISNNNFYDSFHAIEAFGIQYDKIYNNTFSNNTHGIFIWLSDNIVISWNNITSSRSGISILGTSNCKITRNNISSSIFEGIEILSFNSENNYICGNIISNNNYGIYISGNNHTIIHNNFLNNVNNVYNNGNNIWDDGKFGNYWSDYVEKYPDAKPKLFNPWMWDTPYEVSTWPENKDNCPLVKQWPKSYSIDITQEKISTNLFLYKILNNLLD